MPTRVLVVLVALVTAGCAARGATPRPFPGAALPPGTGSTPDPATPPDSSAPAVAEPPTAAAGLEPGGVIDLVQTAMAFLGVPYRHGGSDPSGFDCSGLVQWVFARHGATLPREAKDQYRVGLAVDLRDAQPGDLVFFETVSRGASHVGIVIGEGRFIHAPSSNGVVRVEPYTANYWIRRFVGARRVVDVSASAAWVVGLPGSERSSR